jgi:hypothetical protein
MVLFVTVSIECTYGLWKAIGFGFCEEAGPRHVLHPNYTMEDANLAPMKEEKMHNIP